MELSTIEDYKKALDNNNLHYEKLKLEMKKEKEISAALEKVISMESPESRERLTLTVATEIMQSIIAGRHVMIYDDLDKEDKTILRMDRSALFISLSVKTANDLIKEILK